MNYKIGDLKLIKTNEESNIIKFIKREDVLENALPDFVYNLLYDDKAHTTIDIFNEYLYGSIKINDTSYALDSRITYYYYESNLYLIYDPISLNFHILMNELNNEVDNYLIEEPNMKIILFILLNLQIKFDNIYLSVAQDEIDILEDKLIAEDIENYQVAILKIRKKLMNLKKQYYSINEFLYSASSNRRINQDIDEYILVTLNKCNRLYQETNSLVDHTIQLKELYQSSLDSNMNKTMQFFTVVSSVFLPLTLIVGWYGMNFTNMPELDWEHGYTVVIIIALLVVITMIYFIKKKGFLRK